MKIKKYEKLMLEIEKLAKDKEKNAEELTELSSQLAFQNKQLQNIDVSALKEQMKDKDLTYTEYCKYKDLLSEKKLYNKNINLINQVISGDYSNVHQKRRIVFRRLTKTAVALGLAGSITLASVSCFNKDPNKGINISNPFQKDADKDDKSKDKDKNKDKDNLDKNDDTTEEAEEDEKDKDKNNDDDKTDESEDEKHDQDSDKPEDSTEVTTDDSEPTNDDDDIIEEIVPESPVEPDPNDPGPVVPDPVEPDVPTPPDDPDDPEPDDPGPDPDPDDPEPDAPDDDEDVIVYPVEPDPDDPDPEIPEPDVPDDPEPDDPGPDPDAPLPPIPDYDIDDSPKEGVIDENGSIKYVDDTRDKVVVAPSIPSNNEYKNINKTTKPASINSSLTLENDKSIVIDDPVDGVIDENGSIKYVEDYKELVSEDTVFTTSIPSFDNYQYNEDITDTTYRNLSIGVNEEAGEYNDIVVQSNSNSKTLVLSFK